jgi:geranylgeranyl pyrophosphate synthase
LGQAYQIGDDLLDLQHSGVHGKTSGQDARHKRPTHAVTLDAAGCMQQIGALVKQATSEITNAYGADRASELIEFIAGIFESLARAGRGK